MEAIRVILDDGTGREYDQALRGTLPEGGDLHLITKEKGTVEGGTIVLLTFTVEMANGRMQRVQTATTVKTLIMALRILDAKYGEECK